MVVLRVAKVLTGVLGERHILTVTHGLYPVRLKGQSTVLHLSTTSIDGRHISTWEHSTVSQTRVVFVVFDVSVEGVVGT